MKRINQYLKALLLLALVSGGIVQAQVNAPLAETRGTIEALSFADNTLLIGGTTYNVSNAARVEIGGSFGAFTMLEEGMRVDVEFYLFNDGTREIIMIRELLRGDAVWES